jgi:hypothetical protein
MLNNRDGVRDKRAMLTEGTREYLKDGGKGISRSAQSQHRKEIRQRVVHSLLDFAVLERHLSETDRKKIFDALDAKNQSTDSDDIGSIGNRVERVTCLSDMMAFIYRETRRESGHHPPFDKILERAIIQGDNEPGATYFGKYDISIEVEEITPEEVNIQSIAQRIEDGDIDQLTEAEKDAYLQILSQSGEFDSEKISTEFERLREEYKEEWDHSTSNLSWLLAGGPTLPGDNARDENE